MFELLKDTQNSRSALTQYFSKPKEVMSGSSGQKWGSKLATNIE